MSPAEIYNDVDAFAQGMPLSTICELHSACSPAKGRAPLCGSSVSKFALIDFDKIKAIADKQFKHPGGARKSADALTVPKSSSCLCFVEMKSWEMVLAHNGNEEFIRKQGSSYKSDLPAKLEDSIKICQQITGKPDCFDSCPIVFILLSDITIKENPLEALSSDLDALAGTSTTNLRKLCKTMSQEALIDVPASNSYYWECKDFDTHIAAL